MKVFISWSGDTSREVAQFLREWLSCVLQNVKPWVSTRDIDRGALWFGEISGQLQEAAVGIICLTQDNKNQPWILFEAGALAKGLSTARVCTLLVDLTPADVRDPLAQFNHTNPDKAGMHQLVATLNSALSTSGLEEKVLDQVFETYWPKFEKEFQEIKARAPVSAVSEPVSSNDLIRDVLESVRFISNRIDRMESRQQAISMPTSVTSQNSLAAEHLRAMRQKRALAAAEEMVASGKTMEDVYSFLKESVGVLVARDWLAREKITGGDAGS